VCASSDSRDKRWRSSVYIEGDAGEKIVVDTGPEFRLQAVRAGIPRLDAVLLTHSHADHLHGIDDIRSFTYTKTVPVYANKPTLTELKERFAYIWSNTTQKGGGLPHIDAILVNNKMLSRGFYIGKIKIRPIPVIHGRLKILGWKFYENEKRFVYLTDVSKVPYLSYLKIRRCDVLIIGSLRRERHATHFSFSEALNFAKRIYESDDGKNLREVYLTHICHNHSHKEIENFCVDWKQKNNMTELTIAPAYDTMRITL
jgi:phosphoribosyl 1,2-cyclic phosphate phosphodiesterase